MTPSELLELIKRGCSTKDLSREDVPALVVLFEEEKIVIVDVVNGISVSFLVGLSVGMTLILAFYEKDNKNDFKGI